MNVSNTKKNYHKNDYFTFRVESSYTPANLWIVQSYKEEIVQKKHLHGFFYKKVIAVSYVNTTINNIEIHGKVVSIATGNENYGIIDIFLDMNKEYTDYEFRQNCIDFNFDTDSEIYFIDLDELITNKDFYNLSPVECFAKLIHNDPNIGFHLRFENYIVNSNTNELINSSEYLDLNDAG